MAKYTDPNTGVKYSTHTGLKVFTVIVVILLVISVILNVVLYTQGSDDSELDSNKSEELYGDEGGDSQGSGDEGGDSQGSGDEEGPSASQDGGSGDDEENPAVNDPELDRDPELDDAALYEDDEDSDDSSDEELPVVVNEYVTRTSKFFNGWATCIFYYEDCSICEGECVGHDMYMSMGGGVCTSISKYVTLEPISLSSEEEIRLSLIFTRNFGTKDDFLGRCPDYYEITPLVGDTVDVKSVKIEQDLTYTVSRNEAVEIEHIASYSAKEADTSTKYARIYETDGDFETFGHFTLNVELDDGSKYVYGFKYIDDSALWNELMTEEDREKERAKQEEMQSVTSENDRFEESDTQDENGVTKGRYYYNDCSKCSGSTCSGHTMYRSASGGYYDFYPYTEALTLTDEDGGIISEMQVSLVFEEKPEYEDGCYLARPVQIEVASLTEEELEIDASTLRQIWDYKYDKNNDNVSIYLDGDSYQISLTRSDTSTAVTKSYKINGWRSTLPDGYFGFYLTMSDDSVYSCGFSMVGDSLTWDALKSGNIMFK